MVTNCDGIHIQIISGGIVNFGGANTIAPITVTKSASAGSGQSKSGNSGANVIDQLGTLLNNLMN